MNIEERLKDKREEILKIASSHGAGNVRVFGSVARGDSREGSDLDLLVTFDEDRSLFDHSALVQDLTDLLGIKIDVVSESGLYWLLKRNILREARPL